MNTQLTIVATVYKIDHWSNLEDVKSKLKESLGNMIYSDMEVKELRIGYIKITSAKGCENRIRETIKYELPLTELAPIYSDGIKEFSEYNFLNLHN